MTPDELGSLTAKQLGETPASEMTYRQAIQEAFDTMPVPNLTPSKLEYWKAGVRHAIAAVNRAIAARESKESP